MRRSFNRCANYCSNNLELDSTSVLEIIILVVISRDFIKFLGLKREIISKRKYSVSFVRIMLIKATLSKLTFFEKGTPAYDGIMVSKKRVEIDFHTIYIFQIAHC